MSRLHQGVSILARSVVSVIWAIGTVICFAEGIVIGGIVGLAYLAYLWLFGGRWLIY